MAEQPAALFDAPAGDRPASDAYQPGTWLAEPDADGDWETDALRPAAARRFAQPDRRLLLDRLLEAERRLSERRAG